MCFYFVWFSRLLDIFQQFHQFTDQNVDRSQLAEFYQSNNWYNRLLMLMFTDNLIKKQKWVQGGAKWKILRSKSLSFDPKCLIYGSQFSQGAKWHVRGAKYIDLALIILVLPAGPVNVLFFLLFVTLQPKNYVKNHQKNIVIVKLTQKNIVIARIFM